ncbi:MAG: SDR family NAD(P)-dependent oxidoreductase [Clostridiales bacterium]|nr:SDR family NAD(P)-dependent oxidoreductase [Clostridiales bacterium]
MNPLFCITGAAGGLGKAFAVDCAARGWDLFLTDISMEALNNLAYGLRSTYGIEVLTFQCDLTDFDSRTELFRYTEEKNLKFRGLINVAGIDFEGLFAERSREQILTILRLNIEANLEMTNGILKLRDRSQTFRIINVASLAAYQPMPVKAMYAATKRFLLDFSMALREEVRPLNATVTALCQSVMPTTELFINAINAQVFSGRVTTKNVGFVASRTVNHALKGRAVYIPGVLNKLIKLAGGLVPPALTAHLVGWRWMSTGRKEAAAYE